MILHRIEPGGTTNDEVFVAEAPRSAHRTTGIRITPHRIGIDAVHDDRDTIGGQSTLDCVGPHSTRIGDGEVGAPRQPSFRPVGEGVQGVVLIELHAAGAQPEDELRSASSAPPA